MFYKIISWTQARRASYFEYYTTIFPDGGVGVYECDTSTPTETTRPLPPRCILLARAEEKPAVSMGELEEVCGLFTAGKIDEAENAIKNCTEEEGESAYHED